MIKDHDHTQFHIGANVFVIRDGKLLLGKRKNTVGEGSWGLPGGHLSEGETITGAAVRELFEETGLKPKKLSLVNVTNDVRKDDHRIHFGFLAEGAQGEPVLREPEKCCAWEWFPLGMLPKEIFFGHQKQINAFRNNILFAD